MALAQGQPEGRSVVLASADIELRNRLSESLKGMRWQVKHAGGGAEAMALLERQPHEALLLDHWLPDLEVGEFAGHLGLLYPQLDVLRFDGEANAQNLRSPRRHELLQAMREAQCDIQGGRRDEPIASPAGMFRPPAAIAEPTPTPQPPKQTAGITGMIGESASMRELATLIRMAAPHRCTVLIEGETGTGKELVAQAVHTLSPRATRPLAVLNCAAIPEALLEAELFGHTRGAFTGAVTARTGRIEAANGGTLFLDEIGEMPLPLQAKILRFLECGELQRVGDNETLRVDVRVVAATHRDLEQSVAAGTFRLDLLHRLAVFPIEVPALRDRKDDIPALCEHFLAALGKHAPRKRLSSAALDCLQNHDWPGNVRELGHVIERAAILSGDASEIPESAIRLRRTRRAETMRAL